MEKDNDLLTMATGTIPKQDLSQVELINQSKTTPKKNLMFPSKLDSADEQVPEKLEMIRKKEISFQKLSDS